MSNQIRTARDAACEAFRRATLHGTASILLLHKVPTHEDMKRAARTAVFHEVIGREGAVEALAALLRLAVVVDAEPFVRSVIAREREKIAKREVRPAVVEGSAAQEPTKPRPKCRSGKPGYADMEEARARLKKLEPVPDPDHGPALEVYLCSICNQHHVGRVSAGVVA